VILLTRRYHFPAAHVLRHSSFSEAENQRVYGKCANPAGHGHNYGVEVTVAGPVDEASGRVLDPDLLDRVVAERVLDRFSHRLLNEDAAFAGLVPTAENLALVIHGDLAGPISRLGSARLARVRVLETRRNSFACGEPE
jgi:6-pyruvoyltetrahydropterin/6-carboxytetrahydropterin synthase